MERESGKVVTWDGKMWLIEPNDEGFACEQVGCSEYADHKLTSYSETAYLCEACVYPTPPSRPGVA